MGIIGVLVSSGAGCLSLALSVLAIRRKLRGLKSHRRKKGFHLSATKGATVGTGARETVFIKTSVGDLVRKRRNVIVKTHHGNAAVGTESGDALTESYADHENAERNSPCPQKSEEAIPVDDATQKDGEGWTGLSYHEAQLASVPLKEFTVLGSSITSEHLAPKCGPQGRVCLKRKSVNAGIAAHDCSYDCSSEAESCSFAGGDSLSEEIIGTVENERTSGTICQESELAQSGTKPFKRVSFQIATIVDRQRELSNSRADHEDPVADNIQAMESLLNREDVEILPSNEDADGEVLGGHTSGFGRDAEDVNQRSLPGSIDSLARIQESGVGNKTRENTVLQIGEGNKNHAEAEKPTFVSAEPLGHMPVLEDDLDISLPASTPVAESFSASWTVNKTPSEPEQTPKALDEQDRAIAMPLQKEYSGESFRSDDDEKENLSSSLASSPERLSRQPRREIERSGMFRRSSYPSLKRFRFSDRIKVRPLRSSGRNSK